MIAHLLAPHNAPFAFALGLFFVLGALQIFSLLLGSELFNAIDDLLPDTDTGADLDADADVPDGSAGFAGSLLGLLGIGKVPVIISFLIFAFWFAFVGYNFQLLLSLSLGGPWPAALASLVALAAALPLLRLGNEIAWRVLPGDESSAVSKETFIGKLATITVGKVTHSRASEARLEDEYGHHHYVQVVSDEPEASFEAGEEVVIVGRNGTRFTVVRGPGQLLEE